MGYLSSIMGRDEFRHEMENVSKFNNFPHCGFPPFFNVCVHYHFTKLPLFFLQIVVVLSGVKGKAGLPKTKLIALQPPRPPQ